MGVCEYQAWRQELVFLFPKQIVSVIYANLLEQKTWLKCFETVNTLQNWQPAKHEIYLQVKTLVNSTQVSKENQKKKSSYPTTHIKSGPQDATIYWNVLTKFFNILHCSIWKHCATSREYKVRAFKFHPSLVTFPFSNLVVWHVAVPYLQRLY